jgi:hypothetical protein
MKKSILSSDKHYTFSDFFDFSYPTEDIVKEFSYSFLDEMLDLPRKDVPEDSVSELKNQIVKKSQKLV